MAVRAFRVATPLGVVASVVATLGLIEVVVVVVLAQVAWPAVTAALLQQPARDWVYVDPVMVVLAPGAIAVWSIVGSTLGWRTVVLSPTHLCVPPDLEVPWAQVTAARLVAGWLGEAVEIRTAAGDWRLYSPPLFGRVDLSVLEAEIRQGMRPARPASS